MIKKLLEKIKEYDNIVIYRHLRPDGDAIGSSQGLKEIIKTTFPKKHVYINANDTSKHLEFISEIDNYNVDEFKGDFLAIVVDTATKKRISGEGYKKAKEIFKIDHHNDSENYGDYNWVDSENPACAAMITEFLMANNNELKTTKKGAMYLYVGLVTDTGRFKYRGVSFKTFDAASFLLKYEIDLQDLYINLYVKTLDEFKSQAYIYKKYSETPNGVSYVYFSRKIQKKLNLTTEQTAALTNLIENIKGRLIWILFLEQEDGLIRARLRSRYIAVNDIANAFDGGGHHQASGATLNNKKEIKKMVELADKKLKEFKKEKKDVF